MVQRSADVPLCLRALLICLALCLTAAPLVAEVVDLGAAVQEHRALGWKLATVKKSMATKASISPALDSLKKQEDDLSSTIDVDRERLSGQLLSAVSEGRLQEAMAAVRALKAVGPDDPAAGSFRELERGLVRRLHREMLAPDTSPERLRGLLTLRRLLIEGPGAGLETTPAPTPREPRSVKTSVPIHIAFHWHMHQPIYWPYEDVVTTERRGVYSYSILDLFRSRYGPYTSWPRNAVAAGRGAGLAHLGAQVSFSGSLIENLDALGAIDPSFKSWTAPWKEARGWKTQLGNPRLDLVAFGYHHPLMALVDYEDIRRQIRAHRAAVQRAFGSDVPPSRGIFPPENAFAEWMIPALVDEQISWVMVDNIHFSRACRNYPWVKGENLYPPNGADQTNPDPGSWIQLNGLWAPSKEPAWASRPHWVALSDPDTGANARTPEQREAKMIAIPTSRYLGNEDGRGGFGALDYDRVMSQFLPYNTDPKHPILLVLHHDGDNYGGGTESYYHSNFQRFVEWVKANPDRFVATTVEDYLTRFPPDPNDVIHVEPGSWSGADNGDPEFHKWNGDPDAQTGYSPDRNSWGVLTAVRNAVLTAQAASPGDPRVEAAWKYLMVSETSCYEYWDGTEMWDSHPTRGANQAYLAALPVLEGRKGRDATGPTIYLPQREPYNPGAREWGDQPMPREFTVWTYVHDVSGLEEVVLEYRVEGAGSRGARWVRLPMTGRAIPSQTNPKPAVKADEYAVKVTLPPGTLASYRVAATDKVGNTARSVTQRVMVGTGAASGETPWKPAEPSAGDRVTVTSDRPGALHWGIDGWTLPPKQLWPSGTTPWPDGKSVETPLAEAGDGLYQAILGPFDGVEKPPRAIDFVFHNADGTWGRDWHVPVKTGPAASKGGR
ncbi:MAG: hypothetical protein HY815_08060 [Candidatus Riflebacteria bacterium]|nr:hypothetical protein [Candidatus Riflebacteria bacterium]